MGIFDILTWPIRWLIEAVLVFFHGALTVIGLPADAGYTWLLAILLLLILVRLAVLPLMIASVRSGHKMARLAPDLDAIRKKYADKKDPEAQVAMSVETLALYRESSVNPLGSILPLLVQLPVFIGFYGVLRATQLDHAGVGLLTQKLATSFANSTLFGAPLHDGLLSSNGNPTVLLLGIPLLLIVSGVSFLTQYLTIKYNLSQQADNPTLRRFQRIPLILFPAILAATSLAVQLGLLFYLAFSALWTLGQQLLLIRNLPTPGSRADAARKRRLGIAEAAPNTPSANKN